MTEPLAIHTQLPPARPQQIGWHQSWPGNDPAEWSPPCLCFYSVLEAESHLLAADKSPYQPRRSLSSSRSAQDTYLSFTSSGEAEQRGKTGPPTLSEHTAIFPLLLCVEDFISTWFSVRGTAGPARGKNE